MSLHDLSHGQLVELESQLAEQYSTYLAQGLQLDLTRGKPCSEQLSLSNELDGILEGDYTLNGVDLRNYSSTDIFTGLPEARRLFAEMIDVDADNVLIGGNASLTLMHQCMTVIYHYGISGPDSAWRNQGSVKFLCPVPGYDRHFSICQHLGIEMINIPMLKDGPDMDLAEALVSADPSIKGIWCVPRFSNPTGCVYSDTTVKRLANLATLASDNFRVFYDNAYAVHTLEDNAPTLLPILPIATELGTEDSIFIFGSTSKITFAGAGIAFMAASSKNLIWFKTQMGFMTIGHDKINQARHIKLLKNQEGVIRHMRKHADIIQPRFTVVLKSLQSELGGLNCGEWLSAKGGYFISFESLPGLASTIIAMAAEAGVKLTPAGSAFPYKRDPNNSNIRLAPTVPSIDEVGSAMGVFTTCVKLASVRHLLGAK